MPTTTLSRAYPGPMLSAHVGQPKKIVTLTDILEAANIASDRELLLMWEGIRIARNLRSKTFWMAKGLEEFPGAMPANGPALVAELRRKREKLENEMAVAQADRAVSVYADALAGRGIRLEWKDLNFVDPNGRIVVHERSSRIPIDSPERTLTFDFARSSIANNVSRLKAIKAQLQGFQLGIGVLAAVAIGIVVTAIAFGAAALVVAGSIDLSEGFNEGMKDFFRNLGEGTATTLIVVGVGVALAVVGFVVLPQVL